MAWCTAAILAAAAAPFRSLNARGPILLVVHAADLLAALTLLWLCAGVGCHLLFRLGRPIPDWRARPALAVALGAGVIASALLAAIALFGVRPWVVTTVLLLNLVAARRELLPQVLQRGQGLSWAGESPLLARAAIVTLVALAACSVAVALAPPSDWDSLMYHVLVPVRWARDGHISSLGGNEHVALVGLVQVLYLPFVMIGSLSGPALVSVGLAVLLGHEVFSLSRQAFGKAAAGYASVLVWGTPTLLLVACTPRVDVSLCLFVLLSHGVLLSCLQEGTLAPLDIAAVLMGLSIGVKYQAGAYVLGLLPLILVLVVRAEGSIGMKVRLSARFAAVALIAATPWLLKNQVLFGAPFYPLFASHRIEPWIASLLPDHVASVTVDPDAFRIQQVARASFNLRDAFLDPVKLSVGGEGAFYFLNPLLAALPLCLLMGRSMAVVALAAPPLLYVIVVLVASPETNPRYLIPGVVPLTIVCAAWLVAVTQRLPRLARTTLRVLASILSLVPLAGTMYFLVSGSEVLGNVIGSVSGEQYLLHHPSRLVRSHIRMATKVNQLVSPSDTILMLFESRGLYIDAPAIEDTKLTNWPFLLGALEPDRCLTGSPIKHVIARPAAARYYKARGVSENAIRIEEFERFAARCLKPEYVDSGVALYSTDSR